MGNMPYRGDLMAAQSGGDREAILLIMRMQQSRERGQNLDAIEAAGIALVRSRRAAAAAAGPRRGPGTGYGAAAAGMGTGRSNGGGGLAASSPPEPAPMTAADLLARGQSGNLALWS